MNYVHTIVQYGSPFQLLSSVTEPWACPLFRVGGGWEVEDNLPASQEFDDFKGVLGQDLTKSSFITSYPPAWWCQPCTHQQGTTNLEKAHLHSLSLIFSPNCKLSPALAPEPAASFGLWSQYLIQPAASLQASCHCSPNEDHAVLCSQAQEQPVPGSLRCRSRSKLQMTAAHTDRWSWLG